VFKDPRAMLNTWLPIMMVVMFTGMLISMLWTKVMFQGKAGFTTVLIYALYVLCESVAFGYLFGLARQSNYDNIWIAFVIAGGVFALCAAIAKLMSLKGVFTLGKMIGSAAIAMSVLLIVDLVVMIVWMASRNWQVGQVSDFLFTIVMFCMALVTAGYIIIDIWSISKTDEFINYVGEQPNSAIVWFTAYRLLVDLMNVVLIVIWFLFRIIRDR